MIAKMGPGDPNCPQCFGKGVNLAPAPEHLPSKATPSYHRCDCVLQRDIAANVNKGMRGLMDAGKVPKSPLSKYLGSDLWITAPKPWFMAHLRHVAIRQPPIWFFRVNSDAELVMSWLASASLKGGEIRDPDSVKVSMAHMTLADLVVPPELLIIRLGVKVARNVAAPEVLLEALGTREHLGLPTWIWDTPRERLAEGHICWSHEVGSRLATWKHIGGDAGVENTIPQASYGYLDAQMPTETSGHQDMGLPNARLLLSNGPSKKTLRGGKS